MIKQMARVGSHSLGKIRWCWAVLAVTLVFSLSAPGMAQRDFIPPLPDDPEQVDVYLLTVGRGEQVYALYGHTFLRIVDRSHGLDMSFNWGMFDFESNSFLWNFYTGNMMYSMGISNLRSTVDHYRYYEKRSVVQDRVNLTAAQKMTLMRRIIWNAQPENIRYKYSQILDNCATKPRDYLDEALAGQIKRRLNTQPSPWTFRTYIRAGSSPHWWAYLGLDQMTNSVHDQRLTPWQEMFVPARLRTLLLDMPAFDDAGNPVPGKNLLSDMEVLVDLPEPIEGPNAYQVVALALGLPMILGIWTLLRARREADLARTLGGLSIVFGLWSAFWGTAYTFNWITAGYPEGAHNAGLLLMYPLDWLFVFTGAVMLVRGRRSAIPKALSTMTRWLSAVHVVGFSMLSVGVAFGWITQNSVGMLASTGVISLLFYLTVWRYAAGEELT